MSSPKISPDKTHPAESAPQRRIFGLALLALGVVFGDIGTSPLYALRECFHGSHSIAATPDAVMGIVSLILWTIILIVVIKYIFFVMRADNNGEGGILALMALGERGREGRSKGRTTWALSMMGILGAALLLGNGVITPAISVLSAVEGLNVATPLFNTYIVPISVLTLAVLFLVQSKGTAQIGSLFGPVMLLWFFVLGILGMFAILKQPAILAAVNPLHAIRFLATNGFQSLESLGSVFLAVTGAEVLYADLGHFGRKPIRAAWFYVVLPGLVLNYFGQGAFLLLQPHMADNLFYRIVPAGLLYPMVALATMATVIASQALISGSFSLARQSVQLGLWPRLQIRHTSTSEIGQVYVPFMNWCLFLGTVAFIYMFRESSRLAGAYGIAVAGTMMITTILLIIVARRLWAVRLSILLPLAAVFLFIDSIFFLANMVKVGTGGWIVLVVAGAIFISFKTWIDGREVLRKRIASNAMGLDVLVASLAEAEPNRVSGTAVFLTANPNGVPGALLHNLKHNKVLHERTIIASVRTQEIPYVKAADRARVDLMGKGIYRVVLNYGFCETPDIPATLGRISVFEQPVEAGQTTFFLGRESLVIGKQPTMPMWRKKVFEFLSRNSLNATSFYKLPPNRVVELGSRIEL